MFNHTGFWILLEFTMLLRPCSKIDSIFLAWLYTFCDLSPFQGTEIEWLQKLHLNKFVYVMRKVNRNLDKFSINVCETW